MKDVFSNFQKVKIGIRPIIDGRRMGIRESLEDKTMSMAVKTAELVSKNVFYPDGTPVECVIADTCIGGVAEAAACEDKFHRENVGVSISVTPCWCYGTETLDMDPHRPKAIFGFNGTERPGAVYLACAMAAHSQKGRPAFSIYGHDVQDLNDDSIPDDVSTKLLRFARAGLAAALMRGKSYLSMGGVAMGIGGSTVDDHFFQEYLGMRNEYIDMIEFDRRIHNGIYDKAEYEKAIKWVKATCIEGSDTNPENIRHSKEKKEEEFEYSVKMAMIGRDLMVGNEKLAEMGFVEESCGHNAILSGFQGQRQWTDYMPNGDFMEAILNSSFDWNGIRAPYLVATENDSLNGVAMLLGYLLTDLPQAFCDVRTYWSPAAIQRVTGWAPANGAENGLIHLKNSGAAAIDACGEMTVDGKPAMKPFWQITEQDAANCMKATRWYPANVQYFRGGGFSSQFLSHGGMPMTMVRVNLVRGLGPMLQIAEGYSVEVPEKAHVILEERTDKTWPTTWFAPKLTGEGAFTSTYDVMANWGANHCSLCFGHVGADLITLASILRIPVAMHNVDKKDIFRPSAWAAFGTNDLEGSDYRACANFGPLYK